MGEPIRDEPVRTGQIPAAHLQLPIAVVGMGCRLPGGSNSPQALWDFISKGSVADNMPPASRYKYATHYDGSGRAGTTPSPGAMFLGDEVDIAAFDAAFFNTSHQEAGSIDPQQRQLLEVIYECLENSGETLDRIRGANIGCLVANNGCEYESGTTRDPEDQIPGRSTGCGRSILANRVSHFLDITGPSISLDTACSGTLVAVDMACRYLQFQQADAMIVAGALLYLDPSAQQDRGPMNGALSTSGKCHTFDAKADGYMRAEGVNAVYLKRLDDALRDGDPIRGVIRGSATTGDGRTSSLTQPNPDAQANAIRAAYRNAGISDMNETGYVECHGTGTLAGDPLEIAGLASVFAPARPVDQPLIIGSIKSNIGHSECAAGLSGLIKAVMAVERGVIPGNPTFVTPNPKIDFEKSRVRASRKAMNWPEHSISPRRASVNSFGFGGSNAHVVLEAADTFIQDAAYRKTFKTSQSESLSPAITAGKSPEDKYRILTFSANDRETLPRNVKAISDHLSSLHVDAQLGDVAYTLTDRRTHHFHRGFIITKSLDFDPSAVITGKRKAQPPRIGFVFTGQGAQWPQMGKDLIENLPLARRVVENLDRALQTLQDPPKWSLLAELTEERDAATLRLPELSQPLVTALQITLLAVLQHWGITGHKVLGHSSGEIAAAVAADLLTPEEAIKTAYLRGQAAENRPTKQALGMMAVGISAADAERYLTSKVHVACFNSPVSLTFSGPVPALESVRDVLQKDGHFARLLQVDLAYHSDFMCEIADDYHKMLQEHCPASGRHLRHSPMLSSVTGHAMSSQVGPDYWRANMINPVRFAEPAAEMLSGSDACDFIIEIGPSGALSGPLSQVMKALPGGGKNIQYAAAAKRGPDTLTALFEVAGKLWTSGGNVNLGRINAYDRPSVIVDLPNYQWNHSRRYWREGLATEEHRHRPFISHELLGSKVLSTGWQFPTWTKIIHLSDLPWLKDHRIDNEIIFPVGGYLAMAAEAVRQLTVMTRWAGRVQPETFAYKMKNVEILQNLVLEETEGSRMMLILMPVHDSAERWHTFTIQSYHDNVWVTNCTGFIRIDETHASTKPSPKALEPIKYSEPGSRCYKRTAAMGYEYGSSYQQIQKFQAARVGEHSRGVLSINPPEHHSLYPVHTVTLDGFLQLCGLSLQQSLMTLGENVKMMPTRIGSLILPSCNMPQELCLAYMIPQYGGKGRETSRANHTVSGGLYQGEEFIAEMNGMHFDTSTPKNDSFTKHTYTRYQWDADISLTSSHGLNDLLSSRNFDSPPEVAFQMLFNLGSHQTPEASVLEISMDDNDTSCLWLGPKIERPYASYTRLSGSETAVATMQGRFASCMKADIQAIDLLASHASFGAKHDLGIVRHSKSIADDGLKIFFSNISAAMKEEGQILIFGLDQTSSDMIKQILGEIGCSDIKDLSPSISEGAILASLPPSQAVQTRADIMCLRLTADNTYLDALQSDLKTAEWKVSSVTSTETINRKSNVLILDELFTPITAQLSAQQLSMLQNLIKEECNILWVTSGAQMDITYPDRAATTGFLRTLRMEEVHLRLIALDVEDPTGPGTLPAIETCLGLLINPDGKFRRESEFAERGGVIYTPRLVVDDELDEAKSEHLKGRLPKMMDLQSETCLQLEIVDLTTKPRYVEVAFPTNLEDDHVEVGILATELQRKAGKSSDTLITAAGTIRRLGSSVTGLETGQRVVLLHAGRVANRVAVPAHYVQRIPDELSFKSAASLVATLFAALHGLMRLANLQSGQRVLVYSTGKTSELAAIQVAQRMGAEVYVAIAKEDDRSVLQDRIAVPSNRILSFSKSGSNGETRRLTGDIMFDIVFGSFSVDVLASAWNVIAAAGTLVLTDQTVHPAQVCLSIEPFARGVSFKILDPAQYHGNPKATKQLFEETFKLMNVSPMPSFPSPKIFDYQQVEDALAWIDAGKSRDVMLCRAQDEKVMVSVHPKPRTIAFRDDACYLLIGGLKGLCGSVAIDWARRGAKHLAVMSRSGYDDEVSQMVVRQIESMGCHIDLLQGDITILDDVRRVLSETSVPVRGIIQGSMVLRDRPFPVMTIEEYHQAAGCKITGTWNLHNAVQELEIHLDFFTLLSSIASVLGGMAQANYAVGCAFLDAFAAHRRSLDLPAFSVNLGIIDDVGYLSRDEALLERHIGSVTTGIDEDLMRQIIRYTILQQGQEPVSHAAALNMVTGIAVPQSGDSYLRLDKRFSHLFIGGETQSSAAEEDEAKDGAQQIKELKSLLASKPKAADRATTLELTIVVVSEYIAHTMRLSEPVEPERSLAMYGIDSLAAVAFRNWVRMELGAGLSTGDVTMAPSLVVLCERILDSFEEKA
ncbi:hypothetical protein ACHAQH_008324 [Verticillium albo-atrum]